MKIKLINFRCYSNAEFLFPDNGLILLSGKSGSGKTTILKAILFALFGTKAIKKPCSFGTNTCTVILDFLNLNIKRTNKPNRLLINHNGNILEDEPAQIYIENFFHFNFEQFFISSYIPQKNNSSILSLSQTEQLNLIKTISFHNDINNLFKIKLKSMIKSSDENIIHLKSQHNLLNSQILSLQSTLIPIDFPLHINNSLTNNEIIDNFKSNLLSYNDKIQHLLSCQKIINNDLLDFKSNNSLLTLHLDKSNNILSKINDINNIISDLNISLKDLPIDIEKNINITDLSIQYIQIFNNIQELKKQFNKIKIDELNSIEKQINDINYKLWIPTDFETCNNDLQKYKSEIDLFNNYIKSQNNLLKIIEKHKLFDKSISPHITHQFFINYYKDKLSKISSEKDKLYNLKHTLTLNHEKFLLEKSIISCPNCNHPLHIINQPELKAVSINNYIPTPSHDYLSEINNVTNLLNDKNKLKSNFENILNKLYNIQFPNLNYDINYFQDITTKYNEINNYISINKSLQDKLSTLSTLQTNINNNILSPALLSIQKQINSLQFKLDTIFTKLTFIPDLNSFDILQNKLFSLKNDLNNYNKFHNQLNKQKTCLSILEKEYNNLLLEINILKNKLSNFSISDKNNELILIEKQIQELKSQQNNDILLSQKVDEYINYNKQKQQLDDLYIQFNNINDRLSIAEKKHSALLILKDKYTQAEIITLDNTINSINQHTQYFLDYFFSDNQINAIIKPLQKNKKIDTLQINTQIIFKGNQYDSISQLSGGEFDKCTLASICGINSMLNSPILILDESLSSLDSENNTDILHFLQELSKDKLIIVCSHEAVQGIFDTIITI